MAGGFHTRLRGVLHIEHGTPGRIWFEVTNGHDKERAGTETPLIIENCGVTAIARDGRQYFIDCTRVGLDVLEYGPDATPKLGYNNSTDETP